MTATDCTQVPEHRHRLADVVAAEVGRAERPEAVREPARTLSPASRAERAGRRASASMSASRWRSCSTTAPARAGRTMRWRASRVSLAISPAGRSISLREPRALRVAVDLDVQHELGRAGDGHGGVLRGKGLHEAHFGQPREAGDFRRVLLQPRGGLGEVERHASRRARAPWSERRLRAALTTSFTSATSRSALGVDLRGVGLRIARQHDALALPAGERGDLLPELLGDERE